MKKSNSLKTISAALLSGLMLGLSVNHIGGVSFAFLLPVCMLGIFSALEKLDTLKSWLLHAFVFSFTALSLALLGFTWIELLAGKIMVTLISFLYTLPFALLWFLRKRLCTESTRSFALLALIWPPVAWFVTEKLFAVPITLFSNGLANYPVFIQFIDLTGYTGISAWVIVLNVFILLVYKSIRQNSLAELTGSKDFLKLSGAAMLWFALPLLYAWYSYTALPATFQGYVTATVIQPGYPQDDPEREEFQIDIALALTDSAVAQTRPDIVVWPEAALPSSVRTDENALLFMADRVLRWQTPVATGMMDMEQAPTPLPPLQQYLNRDYFYYNTAAMITPQLGWRVIMENQRADALNVYRKVNLMPFTEYVPFSDRFPFLSRLVLEFGENNHFKAGASGTTMTFLTQDERIVHIIPYICWDILFASTHKAENLQRAHLITTHTSGRLFGDDIKTSLIGIKNYARLRSVEARKSMLKSSTTGYSFFTNPFGEVLGMIEPFTENYSTERVPLNQGLSLYSRFPNGFPVLCLLALILLTLYPAKKTNPKSHDHQNKERKKHPRKTSK
ncbi:MAG: apolipoprotein N-acyltransferase [Balneolales bacterium]|nr:apolipoprotein N-acyltransferase [Balneolales bacterium]